jgi:WD40 repeat protein/tRNA A-37 threonylcarbamoyl transferase component Bud32
LVEELARGGMGVVYRARQVSLNRPVALKMIKAGALASAAEVKRFRLEAEAAANLDHPNIVAIYEVGEHEGQHYFSMRLVEGTSLAAVLRAEGGDQRAAARRPKSAAERTAVAPFDIRHASVVLAKVARAVHFAHQRGILHRDLKPGNILLDAGGEPHVTDFGLAKRVDLPSDLTGSESVMGTPDYMSPEQAQARHKELTTATDLWSLGAVLYYLLTGRAPFHRDTAWETMQAVVHEEPIRPGALQRQVDRDLETICLKCLEKDPQRRYASADALAEDLERWLRNEPIQARPSSTWAHLVKWAKRKPAIAALIGAVAGVALLGCAVSLWYARDARQQLWQAYLAQARAHRWSGQPGRRFDSLDALAKAAALQPALELRNEAIACLALADVREQRRWRLQPPTARWVGTVFDASLQRYARAEQDGRVRICQTRDDRELFRLPSPGKPESVVLGFSPNGQFLAGRYLGPKFSSLHVWDLSQRQLVLSLNDRGYGFDFSPDSRHIAVADSTNAVHFHALPAGREWRVLEFSGPQCLVRFDPAGRRLAALSCQSSTVQILDADSGRAALEFLQSAGVNGLAWSQDGSLLACAGFDGRVYLWDAATGRTNAVLEGHKAAAGTVAFDRTGDLLVSYGWDGLTRFWNLKLREPWLSMPGEWVPLAFAANDTALGFKVHDYEAGLWQIARGEECRRTGVEGIIRGASFDADGRLFAAADETGLSLWDVPRNQLLGRLPTRGRPSAWFHPNGTNLFVSGSEGLQRWPIHFDAKTGALKLGPPQWLWPSALGFAALSVNGECLAAVSAHQPEVLVFPLSRPQEPTVLRGLPNLGCVSISPDGRWVAGGTWKGTGVAIWDTRSAERVKELPVRGSAVVAFSPDGAWLATSNGEECRLWQTHTWAPRWATPRDRAGDLPGALAFSPDGQVLALLESRLSRVKLLAAPEGRELATLPEGLPLAFSHDGGTLASFEVETKRLAFWDLRRIREQLAAMKLDWDVPALPQLQPTPGPEKWTLTVLAGASGPPFNLSAIPPRDPQTASNLIDLSRHYNAGFLRNWHHLGPGEAANNLAGLPTGVQTFTGTSFDVRGLIQLGAQIGIEFPREVRGIVLAQRCRRLHFLHSAVHAVQVPDGAELGRYVIHYAGGGQALVPIVVGANVADWWEPPGGTPPPLVVAWRGTNSAGHRVRLFKTTWDNPQPAEVVQCVDFVGERDRSAPFLVALTAE